MIQRILFTAGALLFLSACSHNGMPLVDDTPDIPKGYDKDVEYINEQTTVVLKTSKGDITLELFPERAPITVANFFKLAGENFYDGVKFHRVMPDFMIQTGDPLSKDDDWSDDGTGGPGYKFADEVSLADQLVKGTVAMANAGPNTNGSQFFIVTAEATPWLNGKHTIFGRVTEGMDVVDAISRVDRNAQDHPLKDVMIEDVVIK
ncbi:MAG: peptidylprolyl isomerase [Candidatus Jacksonbacteria bacterium]|nr:peptidylprolyl isomerase [Candidatus Jacksonbacteria bacterium]